MNALDQLSPDEQKELLSSAAATILPNAGVGSAVFYDGSTNGRDFIRSLRATFAKDGIAEEDIDDLVARFLTEKLKSVHLQGVDRSEVRARLNSKGILPLTSYKLLHHPLFLARAAQIQIRRHHVEEAVIHPTAVQRFSPRENGMTSGALPTILFLTRNHHDEKNGDSILFVQCAIMDGIIGVGQVLRIFPSDIGRLTDSSPMVLLRAFLERFGAKFQIEGQQSTNLMFFDTIPWTEPSFPDVDVVFDDHNEQLLAPVVVARPSPLGALEIALAFFVRVEPYLSSLAARGIFIDRGTDPKGFMSPDEPLRFGDQVGFEGHV